MRIHLASLLLFLVLVSPLQAREIQQVTTNWPPFYADSLESGGPVTEIVKEAFRRCGHTSKTEFLPWTRARRKVINGQADLVLGAYFSEQRAEKHTFSEPIMMVNVGLVAHKNLGIESFKTFHDLTPYNIGITKGYLNNPEFDTANYLSKDVAENQVLNVRKLVHKRVDMISVSFEIFRYELAKLNKQESDYVYLNPTLSKAGLHLMMSKSKPDHLKVIASFNAALKEMKSDGSYQYILKKHGLDADTASAP